MTRSETAPRIRKGLSRRIWKYRWLYVFLIPALIWYIIFAYGPLYGLQIAFRDYTFAKGITGSDWVGLEYFVRFITAHNFETLVWNTLSLNLYGLLVFPAPILLALMLNILPHPRFKKLVQTATYAPHFISVIVLCGMVRLFLSPVSGIVNVAIVALGGERINFMAEPGMFRHIYVWSDVWQNTGWGAIVYLAALSGISPELYEAARVDGAGAWQCFWRVTLPGLLPTLFMTAVLSLLNTFKVFREAYLVGGAYPHDSIYLLQHLFNNWFLDLDVGRLCAAAVLIAAVLLAAILLLQKLWGGEDAR